MIRRPRKKQDRVENPNLSLILFQVNGSARTVTEPLLELKMVIYDHLLTLGKKMKFKI